MSTTSKTRPGHNAGLLTCLRCLAEAAVRLDRLGRAIAGLTAVAGAVSFKPEHDDPATLSLAKSLQATGEALVAVADLNSHHARSSLLPVQELLREASYPHAATASLIETNRQALAFHAQLAALPVSQASADALARADTVLNLLGAELERAHLERAEDLRHAAEMLLDSEIELHRAALDRLAFARSHFAEGEFEALAATGPRLRSKLGQVQPREALVMPSRYGVPSGGLERRLTGVGSLLLGGTVGEARAGGRRASLPVPTAETLRQLSVGEILTAQERGWGDAARGAPA